jgi:hypothetical protein
MEERLLLARRRQHTQREAETGNRASTGGPSASAPAAQSWARATARFEEELAGAQRRRRHRLARASH